MTLVLPLEILNGIFSDLKNRRDLRTCLMVCKSWNPEASAFLQSDIQVVLNNHHDRPRLLTDLSKYSAFGPKVTRISFKNNSCGTKNEEIPADFKSIMVLCTNLTFLSISACHDSYGLFRVMSSKEVILPVLQEFYVSTLVEGFSLISKNLSVHYKFRTTLTNLVLFCFSKYDINALKQYGGLYKFVSSFSKLKKLEIDIVGKKHRNNSPTIDIARLLTSATVLEELSIDGVTAPFKLLTNNKTGANQETEENTSAAAVPYKTMKKVFLLGYWEVDLNSMKYVMKTLSTAEELYIIPCNDYHPKILIQTRNLKDFKRTFGEFKGYCRSIEQPNVFIRHYNSNRSVAFGVGKQYVDIVDVMY